MDNSDHLDIVLSGDPLSLERCRSFVLHPSCGGLCYFEGTIRDLNLGETVTHLEFEAYAPMAVKEMRKIAAAARARFDLHAVALHHRTGDLAIGETAVIIAVSSVHRKPAFEGCEYVIDELKKHVPIWKKEYRMDGSHWINARP